MVLAQSPGGMGGSAQEFSKAASDKGVQPIVIVVGILVVLVLAIIVFKLKRE